MRQRGGPKRKSCTGLVFSLPWLNFVPFRGAHAIMRLRSATRLGSHRELHMNQGNLSRRGFLQRSLAGLTAAGLPAWYAQEVLADDQEKAAKDKKPGPNDRIQIGLIGTGDRCKQLLGDLRRHK